MATNGPDIYVVDDYWLCDYCDFCYIATPVSGGGSAGPGHGNKKPEKQPGKPGQRAANVTPGDFTLDLPTDGFAAALLESLPQPTTFVHHDVTALAPLDQARMDAIAANVEDALLGAQQTQQAIAARAQQDTQARIAAQHAEWDRNALIIAVVNATMAQGENDGSVR